ncbi:MAG TPA: site-specific integrase [Verrucomicrobiae bacterium]|nr:site-specific integrase [Verrucomicrobiae bacterium]
MAILERTRRTDGIKTYLIDFRDQHGTRVRETAGTTRRQAKDLLTRRLGEVRARTYVNPRDAVKVDGPSFSAFADRFLEEYGSLRRSNYYAERVKFLKEYFGALPLQGIRRADLDLFAVERSRKEGVSGSTVRKDLTVLGTMFRMAVRWGVLEASPAVDLEKPSEPHHRTRYLSREEWGHLQEAAPPWLRPILTVAVATGMRLKEIVGLRWDGVDREDGLLYVSEDNKTGQPRAIPIGRAVREVLSSQVRHVRVPFVFADSMGEPFTSAPARNRVSKATKAVMKAAGISGASFHTLRHTAGSWAAQAGMTEIEIAKLLGHATTATTRRYTHLQPAHLKAAVRAIDAVMSGAVDTPVDTQAQTASASERSVAATPSSNVG